MDWGKGLGQTLVHGFPVCRECICDFVSRRQLDFKGLVASILEDLAVLQFRNACLTDFHALSVPFVAFGGGSAVTAAVVARWRVGLALGYSRQVRFLAFAGAPRNARR